MEFGERQNKLERGKWLTSTPVWVDRTAQKEEGRQKSNGNVWEQVQAVGEVEETQYLTTE